jgi:hypothetical protein
MSAGIEPGFAVVDLETTGWSPNWRDRVVEIAVVQVDPKGCVKHLFKGLDVSGAQLARSIRHDRSLRPDNSGPSGGGFQAWRFGYVSRDRRARRWP